MVRKNKNRKNNRNGEVNGSRQKKRMVRGGETKSKSSRQRDDDPIFRSKHIQVLLHLKLAAGCWAACPRHMNQSEPIWGYHTSDNQPTATVCWLQPGNNGGGWYVRLALFAPDLVWNETGLTTSSPVRSQTAHRPDRGTRAIMKDTSIDDLHAHMPVVEDI